MEVLKMPTKKELEEMVTQLEEKLIDKEFERYTDVQRLTERIIKQENTINELVYILEESFGKTIKLTDDNGLRLVK